MLDTELQTRRQDFSDAMHAKWLLLIHPIRWCSIVDQLHERVKATPRSLSVSSVATELERVLPPFDANDGVFRSQSESLQCLKELDLPPFDNFKTSGPYF